MAHILVYLQRTPGGLHPASSVALCRARDIASERGATITAICRGDAGPLDKGVAAAASRFGADVLVFGGPQGLHSLFQQLNPVHVLVPWTDEGLSACTGLPNGPAVPRWLTTRQPEWGGADAVTAVVAGTLPWHAFSETLEAEYQTDVDQCELAPWIEPAAAGGDVPVFGVLSEGPLHWLATEPPGPDTAEALSQLGAVAAASPDQSVADAGAVLWLSSAPVPAVLAERPAGQRLLVLPGTAATALDPSWRCADWVLPGSAAEALSAIVQSPWAPMPR